MAYVTPPTAVSNTTATAVDFNILGADIEYLYGISLGVTFTGCKVTRMASTNISDSTWTPVTFTAESFDYGGWFTSGTDVVVPAGAIPAGFTAIAIMVIARTKFAANGTGSRAFRLSVNGTPFMAPTVPGIASDATVWGATELTVVEAGDVVTLEMYQTSGGTLAASDMVLTVVRYAPAA